MLSSLSFTLGALNAQNVQNTQNDAYFQDESNHELRSPEDGVGFGFDDLSPTGGYGFTFDLFDENIGNGFEFDNFGNELNYNNLEFGNFDMAADEVPLNDGMLLMLGFALAFAFARRRRRILETDTELVETHQCYLKNKHTLIRLTNIQN